MSKGSPISPIMNLVASKNGMNARRTTQVVAVATMPRSATQRAAVLGATLWVPILRAIFCVRLLAKGMTLCGVAFLASHPEKSGARS